jgi:uracil phosphoribosyltransferase
MNNIHVNNHPIVQDRLTRLRNKSTRPKNFRLYLNEIGRFLSMDATENLGLTPKTIETPLMEHKGALLNDTAPLIIPILRAGLALSEPLSDVIPDADIAHIGLYRDPKTKKAVEYLNKLPSNLNRPIFVVDPMLATAHSMIKALDIITNQGANQNNITIITLVCAPEGLKKLRDHYPEILVYTSAIDNHLDDNAYIVPGVGDAGDRYFGTDH